MHQKREGAIEQDAYPRKTEGGEGAEAEKEGVGRGEEMGPGELHSFQLDRGIFLLRADHHTLSLWILILRIAIVEVDQFVEQHLFLVDLDYA